LIRAKGKRVGGMKLRAPDAPKAKATAQAVADAELNDDVPFLPQTTRAGHGWPRLVSAPLTETIAIAPAIPCDACLREQAMLDANGTAVVRCTNYRSR